MTTTWEDNDGCAKQYRCALDIYLITLLLYLHGIIIDCTTNAPGHRNISFYGLKDTDKQYLREQMELLGKSASNDTSNTGMLPSALKHFPVNFEEQCLKLSLIMTG